MAYSAIFHGCLRAAVSARPSGVHRLRRAYRASVAPPSASPVASRTGAPLLRSARPPTLLGRRMVACLAVEVEWRRRSGVASRFLHRQSSNYGRFAYQDVSSDESDVEVGSSQQQQMHASTLDNVEEWKWKLTMLVRNKEEQEMISRERKDRRDFEQLSALATRMGLYSHQYSKVLVFSKVPLPNYRSDLDDRRPQREVVLPYRLQMEVDTHLQAYLSRKPKSRDKLLYSPISEHGVDGSIAVDDLYGEQERITPNSVVVEKIQRRRSLQLRNKQQDWQECPEGQKMIEFRQSLPAYKERDALLKAISENQVEAMIIYRASIPWYLHP